MSKEIKQRNHTDLFSPFVFCHAQFYLQLQLSARTATYLLYLKTMSERVDKVT